MKEIGEGIAWLGFWIGLGLYNFQGCQYDSREAQKIIKERYDYQLYKERESK